ncbi:MAG: Npt1/Npt2 family nucleotide transporter [Gammaproteobacteria bacterium]
MSTKSTSEQYGKTRIQSLKVRSIILFSNFFLIILAYYQVKSASRSLLIEYWGSDNFPWVWIASALVLGSFIGLYHRLVERYSRLAVVLGSCLMFIVLLVGFRVALDGQGTVASVAFYIFVDIFSVILVEQFWSLADTVTEADAGRKSYWFIGSGGLLGGVIGGAAATAMLEFTPMRTPDLLLSCAAILIATFLLNLAMGRMGLYREVPSEGPPVVVAGGWRALIKSRYLILIACALLCSQLAQPVVEFQFIKAVEASYTALDARTQFISSFFSVLGLVSIAINLLVTPFLHRYLGVMWGMVTQPVVLAVSSLAFMAQPTLMIASVMKIADRGLSYSINRASKEQLYIPVDPVRTYQAKAWIDMLGYRLFKVLGSAIILVLANWIPLGKNAVQLGWMTLLICLAWSLVLALLAREYHTFVNETPATV